MSVIINETNFPNENFRNYVSQYYDLDGDGVLSDEEIAEVTSLTFEPDSNSNVGSIRSALVGIEIFSNLIELQTFEACFSGVQVSRLSMLKKLVLRGSYSTWSYPMDIDLHENLQLQELRIVMHPKYGRIDDTAVRSLVLSPSLQIVYIQIGGIAGSAAEYSLDFSSCVHLQKVLLNGVSCETITGLSNKQYLERVIIANATFCTTPLVFDNDAVLTGITCLKSPNVTECSVTNCQNLEYCEFISCGLRGSLDLQTNTKLIYLAAAGTNLRYLNLGTNSKLQKINIITGEDNIAISSLDIRSCSLLRQMMSSETMPPSGLYGGGTSSFLFWDQSYAGLTGERWGLDTAYNYRAEGYAFDGTFNREVYIYYDKRTTIIDVDQPSIESSPASVNVASNTEVCLQVSSTGQRLAYQWQMSADNGEIWTDITGATTDTYTFTVAKAYSGNQYRCVVTNTAGTAISDPATLTVYDPPTVNTELIISIAGNGKNITLVSNASGDELNYQWQISSDNVTWTDITENGTGETYSFTGTVSQNHTYYRYRVWNLVGEAFSNSAELIVVTTPLIDASPASVTKATGTEASFSVNTQGEYLSYQWQVSSDNGESWTDISDATEDSYSFTTARTDSGKQYKCVATNAAGTVESDPATLTVYDPPVIVSRSTIQECVAEGTEVTLSVTASGDDLQYKWQVNQNGEWTDIENATDPSYTFTAVREDTGKRFQCYIYNAVGNVTCEIYDNPEHSASGATPIAVVYQPRITDQTITSPVQTGNEAVLTVSAEGGRLSYQWQVSSDNGENWANIEGAVTNPYSFTSTKADSGKQYRCHVENIAGEAASTPLVLTVMNPPVINSALSISPTGEGKNLTLTADASGDDLHYQWQASSDNATWTVITENGTGETYTFTADVNQNHTFYRYRAWNLVGEAYSNSAELIVVTAPVITGHPESQTLVVESQAAFTIDVQGEALDYQWQASSDNGVHWTNIPDATEDSYSFTATKADSGKQYRCHAENIAGEAVSEAASLTVLFLPVVLTSPAVDDFVSEGISVTLEAVASGDELSHKWYVKYGDIDQWYPIEASEDSQYADLTVSEQTPYLEDNVWHSGEKKVSLTFTAARELSGNQYRCEFSNDVGSVLSAATNALVVLFEPRITQIISPANAVRNGDPVSLAVIAEGGNLSYRWTVSTDNGESWENIADSGNDNTYSFIATVSQNDYLYACTVTNLAGSCTSDLISFVVQVPPSVSQSPASAVVGNNATATFHATFDGTQLHYQWQVSSDNGATWIELEDTDSDTYSFTASIEKDGHLYRCRASNELGFVASGSALLTVLTYPAIVTQPSSASVDYASNVVFLVSATGGNLFYQWQYSSNNGATWKNVTKNGTNATYSFLVADTQNGYLYRCLVANNLGSVTSNAATLTVIGSATSEDEHVDQVYAGKYLPSQMADMIRSLPVGETLVPLTSLDATVFGENDASTLHATLGNKGSTDPLNYEHIADAINELKALVAQLNN